jgi:hypothetical protein
MTSTTFRNLSRGDHFVAAGTKFVIESAYFRGSADRFVVEAVAVRPEYLQHLPERRIVLEDIHAGQLAEILGKRVN